MLGLLSAIVNGSCLPGLVFLFGDTMEQLLVPYQIKDAGAVLAANVSGSAFDPAMMES